MMRKLAFVLTLVVLSCFAVHGQALESSNLPIFIINTGGQSIPDEPKITATMGIVDNGPGQRNHTTDAFNVYDGKIGIELRGSSSRVLFPKKQFAVELRTALGADTSVSLLGLPAEEDWILSAPYNDKTLMRDVLAYKLGRDLGRYAPRTKYCELVLNGSYEGVYFLNEKIKRDKNRVDIASLNPDEVSGDDLTGGYIIKLDKYDGSIGPGFDSQFAPPGAMNGQHISFQFEYPKWDVIVSQQKAYIQNYVSLFENALNGQHYADPDQGYAKYIDVDSFVDFFIMNELTKNVDGYRLSTFLYKQKDSDGGKLFIGPIWDFNLGFGNADYCTSGSHEGFVYDNFNKLCPGDFWLIPFWWKKLFRDGAFGQKVADRWQSLRQSKFSTPVIHAYIDSVASVLTAESQQRNFQRWPETMGSYIWPNYYVGPTYQAEVNWLKQWIELRADWLDQQLPGLVTGTEPDAVTSIQVHPNPFTKEVTVSYSLRDPGYLTIQILNSRGELVNQFIREHGQIGVYEAVLGGELAQGLYVYRALFKGKQIKSGRLIKN